MRGLPVELKFVKWLNKGIILFCSVLMFINNKSIITQLINCKIRKVLSSPHCKSSKEVFYKNKNRIYPKMGAGRGGGDWLNSLEPICIYLDSSIYSMRDFPAYCKELYMHVKTICKAHNSNVVLKKDSSD